MHSSFFFTVVYNLTLAKMRSGLWPWPLEINLYSPGMLGVSLIAVEPWVMLDSLSI